MIIASSLGERSWLAAVFSDLRWLKDVLPNTLAEMVEPETDLRPWLLLVRTSSWSRIVSAAYDASKGKLSNSSMSPDECETSSIFFCYECGKSFLTMNDLNNHAHRSHGYISPTRRFAPCNTCLACLMSFGSRERIVQHLHDRKACVALLQSVYTPLPDEQVHFLDKQAIKIRKARKALAPAVRMRGSALHAHLAVDGLRCL